MSRLLNATADQLPEGFCDDDLKLAKWLRAQGILRPIEDAHFTATSKVALCSCFDGLRFCDIFNHFHIRLPKGFRGNPLIFPITLAGAPLLIASESQVLLPNSADRATVRKHIGVAEKLGVELVINCSHWPCKAAIWSGVSFAESLYTFCQGKREAVRLYPNLKFAAFLDLDIGDGQLTYYHSTSDMLDALDHWNAVCNEKTL